MQQYITELNSITEVSQVTYKPSNINNLNHLQNLSSIRMCFQDRVNDWVSRLLDRVEKEVHEYGDFAPLFDFFDNEDGQLQKIVGKFGLKL